MSYDLTTIGGLQAAGGRTGVGSNGICAPLLTLMRKTEVYDQNDKSDRSRGSGFPGRLSGRNTS